MGPLWAIKTFMEDSRNAKPDLTEAWERVRGVGELKGAVELQVPVYYPRVPRWTFPYFSALFVCLSGVMAVVLFGVGKVVGGLLFSAVVLVGLYVLYNNVRERVLAARVADVGLQGTDAGSR